MNMLSNTPFQDEAYERIQNKLGRKWAPPTLFMGLIDRFFSKDENQTLCFKDIEVLRQPLLGWDLSKENVVFILLFPLLMVGIFCGFVFTFSHFPKASVGLLAFVVLGVIFFHRYAFWRQITASKVFEINQECKMNPHLTPLVVNWLKDGTCLRQKHASLVYWAISTLEMALKDDANWNKIYPSFSESQQLILENASNIKRWRMMHKQEKFLNEQENIEKALRNGPLLEALTVAVDREMLQKLPLANSTNKSKRL